MLKKSGNWSLIRIKNTFIVLVLACSIILSFQVVSCAPEQEFGELIICSEVDSNSFEPADVCDNFNIEVDEIFAAVEVSGVNAEDKWRFTWKNLNTGEVIADSTNIYSSETTGYIEGFFSNKLVPSGNGKIIAEPGDYLVDFYHNGELKATGEFKINRPSVEIIEVTLSKEIDEQGNPVEDNTEFFQRDTIFAAVKVSYKMEGEQFGIKWFKNEDELLEEENFIVDENLYVPGYIVFQLINEDGKALPIDTYRVEILHAGEIAGEHYFDIVPEEFSLDLFSDGSKYINNDYFLEFDYPNNWSFTEEEIESGLKVQFVPEETERNIIVNIWALDKKYSPEEDDYIDFADNLLDQEEVPEGENGIERTDGHKVIGDIELFEIEYWNNEEGDRAWYITFNFLKNDDMLYLFMKLSGLDYLDYTKKILDQMIGSLKFEDSD
jgi:hypothetical protein